MYAAMMRNKATTKTMLRMTSTLTMKTSRFEPASSAIKRTELLRSRSVGAESRRTVLGADAGGPTVQTVEHLLSALAGLGIGDAGSG